jgi:demethylmenaquinone methyltransferase/2-methoxy-6-polyprenyl-1,4-benzoquinol methylase
VNRAERRYYDLRAPEYDDWYLGRGPFAERERPGWDDETAWLAEIVAGLPARRVLDAACGTGFLTQHLPGEVTALDQSAAMLELARERRPDAELVAGDALELPFPDRTFDLVFTAHFYGHLRETDRVRFLAEARRVAPGLVVVDTALGPDTVPEEVQERRLVDGSCHRVYKRTFTAEGLAAEIGGSPLFAGDWYVAAAT